MRKKISTFSFTLSKTGAEVPVKVVFEARQGYRYAITTRGINLRLPSKTSKEEVLSHLLRLGRWLEAVIEKKPHALDHFLPKAYTDGAQLRVGDRQYTLVIRAEKHRTASAYLEGRSIHLCLSAELTAAQRAEAISTLIARVVAVDFQPEIERRVRELNQRTVQGSIRAICLRNNSRIWGSCSTRGVVHLSTRLLLAPRPVQDYVVLHELVHLVEPNHSERFWALVAHHMPDYLERERWLQQYGNTCRF